MTLRAKLEMSQTCCNKASVMVGWEGDRATLHVLISCYIIENCEVMGLYARENICYVWQRAWMCLHIAAGP